MAATITQRRAAAAGAGTRARSLLAAEAASLLVAPLAAYAVLRPQLMPPPDVPDASMHTTYILDPQSIFLRYTAVFTPTSRLREGARVGLLIPGRISYLLFGAFPGFVVLRYLLALLAIVPAYVLLRRLYGVWAGAAAVVVVLSSPVILTAWGTDFPDSVTVSYLLGGFACLAMPSQRRRLWLAAAAVLFTLAVWAFASAGPLIAVALGVYAVLRLRRDRPGIWRDAAMMGAVAVAVTVLLGLASRALLGQFDFVRPTIASLIFLAHPSQEALWHSARPVWAPYVSYLLVLPMVVGAWLVAFGPRLGNVPTPQLLVGLTCAGQVALAVLLQFVGRVQVLEMHYFSSLLWAALTLAFTMALVELARPLLRGGASRWALPLLLLAVALAYELDPHVPAFGWIPAGLLLAAAGVLLAVAARAAARLRPAALRSAAGVLSLVLLAGTALVLTVAGVPAHRLAPGTVYDPPPAYAAALGGDASHAVDLYRVTAQIPGFVGPARYANEQLLTWWPWEQYPDMLGPEGIYHAGFNSIPWPFGTLTPAAAQTIESRAPAQVLFMSYTGASFPQALAALTPYRPSLVRTGVLRSGTVALHVWLVDLERYIPPGRQA